jgi:hypothetical protein
LVVIPTATTLAPFTNTFGNSGGGGILHQPSDNQVLQKGSAPWSELAGKIPEQGYLICKRKEEDRGQWESQEF